MENPGNGDLRPANHPADPKMDTPDRQRGYVTLAAHELAHQWFGDLVTHRLVGRYLAQRSLRYLDGAEVYGQMGS